MKQFMTCRWVYYIYMYVCLLWPWPDYYSYYTLFHTKKLLALLSLRVQWGRLYNLIGHNNLLNQLRRS